MDTKQIAESVLKEYNGEKDKKKGKVDFRKIVLKHYQAGIFSGISYTDFFDKISKECHKIQPGGFKFSKSLGDKLHKAHKNFKFSTGIVTETQVEKDYKNKIRELGGGNYEEGLEYYEQILNG